MVTKQNKISSKIVEKLRLRSKKITAKEEIFQVIGEYQRIYKKRVNSKSIWTYVRKSQYIKRILGDYYYVYSLEERHHHYCQYSDEELIFLVLEEMKIKWYLGLERALQENKIRWQALNVVPIINVYFSGVKRLGNSQFKFIKTQEKKFACGIIEKKTANGVKYFYADLEKTYLDFLYFHSYQGKDMEIIHRQLDFKIKKKVVRRYAQCYSKKILRML